MKEKFQKNEDRYSNDDMIQEDIDDLKIKIEQKRKLLEKYKELWKKYCTNNMPTRYEEE